MTQGLDFETATAATGCSCQFVREEAVQLSHWDQPAPAELDGAKTALVEELVDGVVADVQILSGRPGRDGQGDQNAVERRCFWSGRIARTARELRSECSRPLPE